MHFYLESLHRNLISVLKMKLHLFLFVFTLVGQLLRYSQHAQMMFHLVFSGYEKFYLYPLRPFINDDSLEMTLAILRGKIEHNNSFV
uniref:Uncharacterized protein n=1 Tax=Arundo donax TaxID=35708 RepID=A0A0A9FV69_ARUDO